MAMKLKTYEGQATLSVILAAVGGVFCLAAAGAILQHFDWKTFLMPYRGGTLRGPVIGILLLLALASATVGFFVGFNSAGQRRNTKSRVSWTGFFINAAVVALTLSLILFFWFTRYKTGTTGQ